MGLQLPSWTRRGPEGCDLTSVGHHPHVGPDHVQVNSVLLFSNDHCPPQAPIGGTAVLGCAVPKQIRTVPRHVLGGGHGGVIWKQQVRGKQKDS